MWRMGESSSCQEGVFLRENEVFSGGGVLGEIVTLVAVIKLLSISEAHKHSHKHLLIHQTICTVDNTHERTVNNGNIFLCHFHQQFKLHCF